MSEQLESAKQSLEFIQRFDADSLSRRDVLGTNFAFDDAIVPAQRIIDLFNQISADELHYLPDKQLNQVQGQADNANKIFQEILSFDSSIENNKGIHTKLISNIRTSYDGFFNALYAVIGYLSSRITDFSALQNEANAVIQSVRDAAETLTKDLQQKNEVAEAILAEVRKAAAEQGVTQQAKYFAEEASKHETAAGDWGWWTIFMAIFLGVFAIGSLFMHNIPGLQADSYYETIQIAVSKVFIFGAIGYMLVLFARNFLSHTHNAIVNKHRQNALMTFKTLVDAAQIDEKQDIVLAEAAACIFSPQETGYTKHSSSAPLPAGQTIVRNLESGMRRTTGGAEGP